MSEWVSTKGGKGERSATVHLVPRWVARSVAAARRSDVADPAIAVAQRVCAVDARAEIADLVVARVGGEEGDAGRGRRAVVVHSDLVDLRRVVHHAKCTVRERARWRRLGGSALFFLISSQGFLDIVLYCKITLTHPKNTTTHKRSEVSLYRGDIPTE